MAENVAVTTLEIKGIEQVATTMKELKKQIADYRDELVALGQIEDKTEEQREEEIKVIEKLRKATKLLSDVQNAHKVTEQNLHKAIDLNTGSYNELQAEMSKLKKMYKDMSAQERDSDLGKETLQTISQLDVKLKELDAGMGQYQRNVGNYGQTFEQSLAQARQNAGYLGQGIDSLAGTMSLMGVESEGAMKAMQGLKVAMQVVQNEGVGKLITKFDDMITSKIKASKATRTLATAQGELATATTTEAVATTAATNAAKLWNKALLATGIGAIVVAIGALIANWKDLKKAILSTFVDYEKAVETLEKEQKLLENNIELMKAKGATNEEVFSAELNSLSTLAKKYDELALSMLNFWDYLWQKDEYEEALEKAAEKQEELNDKLIEAERHLRGIIATGQIAYDERNMSDYEKSLSAINRQYAAMEELRKNLYMKGEMSPAKFFGLGEDIDTWYQQQIDLLNEERQKAQDERLKTIKEQEAKEREERLKARKKTLDDLEKYEEDANIKALEEEEKYGDEVVKELESRLKREVEARQAAKEKENKILMETLQAHEEAVAKEKELAEQKKANMIESAESAASSTKSLLDAMADAYESLNADDEEASKKTKGLRIASTLIETISGATGAFMQAVKSIPPPAGIAVGTAQASAVLATGMANIAKMKAASVGSSLSSSISSAVSAPNVPTSLESVRNITSASEEARLNRMAQSQKVYILQSDIEAANAAAKAVVSESSF
jgi:hypothetical protein